MKKKYSWQTVIFVLMAFTFIVLLVSILAANLYLYRQASHTIRENNAQMLSTRVQEVNLRLDNMREHIWEIVRTLDRESPGLTSDSQLQRFRARSACYGLLRNKLAAAGDMDYLFLYQKDLSTFLLCSSYEASVQEQVSVVKFVKSGSVEEEPASGNQWSFVQVEGTAFFLKAHFYGEFVVGVLSRATHYDRILTGDMEDIGAGYFLLKDGEQVYAGGHDWSGTLGPEEVDTARPQGVTVVSQELDRAQLRAVLVTRENTLSNIWASTTLLVTLAACLFLLLLVLLMVAIRRLVSRPMGQMLAAIKRIEGGDFTCRIEEEPPSSEFLTLRNGFNAMVEQIVNLQISKYEHQLVEKENELAMLRAQIRPHFFLNAVTTVASMTYQDRDEDIRRYLTALSSFIRYMLQLRQKEVRLGDELANIRNYFEMQKIRFPGSIACYVGCQAGLEEVPVPYLLLFTAVENTIKHAMNLYDTLNIFVHCESYSTQNFTGIRLLVEDNGPGFSRQILERYERGQIPAAREGNIGLGNIYQTLELTYGRKDLLKLSNAAPHGAHVELWIPWEGEKDR